MVQVKDVAFRFTAIEQARQIVFAQRAGTRREINDCRDRLSNAIEPEWRAPRMTFIQTYVRVDFLFAWKLGMRWEREHCILNNLHEHTESMNSAHAAIYPIASVAARQECR